MIGLLDLQGGVSEHREHLEYLGVGGVSVSRPEHLDGLSGLIIPGGESTCISKLLEPSGLKAAIAASFHRGLKIWGTCAGAILLASEVLGGSPVLSLMEMTIERNSFGSQLDSFTATALVRYVADVPLPLVFIRAPKIVRVGAGVETMLTLDGYIAAAENAGCLATVFHPELTGSNAFHRYFARKCGDNFDEGKPLFNPLWRETSWMRLGADGP